MPRPFLDTSPGYLERSFHFNVTTAFVLSKAATPHLLASGDGSIVNISSAIGRLRDRGFVGLRHRQGRALAHDAADGRRPRAEGARERHRGRLDRDERARRSCSTTPRSDDEMVRRTPLKRLGEPEDIALCALYLASPAASFVTGKLFEIDGGLEEANLELGLPDLD